MVNGLSVGLPANAVVNALTNAAYNGQVNVAAQWISPLSNDMVKIMPGDLRGITKNNALKLLNTYGMAAVELSGTAGQLLQLAPGKKATLSFPLPATVAGTAPVNIPLWYFDEVNGLWREDGVAVKTSNSYVGQVSHFSFWNCDTPADYVDLSCTLMDDAGNPLPNVLVKLSIAVGSSQAVYGYTDTSGYVSGPVPANSQLLLEILSPGCANALYTQNFAVVNVPLSLGNIIVQAVSHVNGNVVNCSNNPVTNGDVLIVQNGVFNKCFLSPSGSFSYSTFACSDNTDLILIANDNDNDSLQSGQPTNLILSVGINSAGTLISCAVSSVEYFNYTITDNDPAYPDYKAALISPVAIFSQYIASFPEPAGAIAIEAYAPQNPGDPIYTSRRFYLTADNIHTNSVQALAGPQVKFFDHPHNIIGTTTTPVYITEYGGVGSFIAGYFLGSFNINTDSHQQYITCSFRVRRKQ